MMKIEIISVGSELVCGQIRDLNAPLVASRLTELGLDVISQTIISDNSADLRHTLQIATERASLVIITGGLGPTADDITRKTVSDFCNVKLLPDVNSINYIENLTKNAHSQKYINNLRQAMIPEGGVVIHNATGTAQGFLVKIAQCGIICLPGVPTEMVLMLEDWVIPYILREAGERKKRCKRVINTFGMSESILDEKVRKILSTDDHLTYSTLVNDGIISIGITVRNTEEHKAIFLLNETEKEICRELGQCVFNNSGEPLEVTVSTLLRQQAITLAIAESCTGGLVSSLLTNVPGSSAFLAGGIVSYSNKVKQDLLNVPEELIIKHGVISSEVAKAMASGVRKCIKADIGLAVTGIAGPSGTTEGFDQGKPVGLVYVSTATNEDVKCAEYRFFGSRIDIKKRAANAVLNMLRLRLLEKF